MPRYDPDIIAALAEGRLDPDQAADLTRQIANDPAALAELAAQQSALAALASAPRPSLSDAESVRLRTAVADALGITTPDAVAATGRRVPWGSLGIAAAALAALVAVVPVVGLLSTGGADSASLDLAAEAPTTTAASVPEERASTDEAGAVVGDVEANDALISGEAGDSAVAGFGSSTTHPPAPTTAAPATQASTTTAAAEATAETTTSSVTTAAATAPEISRLTDQLTTLRSQPETVQSIAVTATEGDTCWLEDTNIRADPPPERYRFEFDDGELTVIVYYTITDGVLGPFQVWGLPDCADLVVIP